MKTAVSLFGSLLLLSCAQTAVPMPAAPSASSAVSASSPVNVVVTSQTATKELMDDVRKATLTNIEKQAPNARPLTLTAALYVSYQAQGGPTLNANYGVSDSNVNIAYGNFGPSVPTGRPVAEISPTPGLNGFTPTVPNLGGSFPSSHVVTRGPITWMRVSYMIKDASGRVVELKELWQPAERARTSLERIFPYLYDSARVSDTAAYLASRVAALSH